MREKINNIKTLYTGNKNNTKITLELLYTFYCFPGFIIHELSHILMIVLTLSFDKYTGHKWSFLEFFEEEAPVDSDIIHPVKKKGYLQSYALTINFADDIHPVSLFLIAAAPIFTMVGMYLWIIFSGLNMMDFFFYLILFFSIIKGLSPSDADYRSINISYRKSKAYYLKKKRAYFV